MQGKERGREKEVTRGKKEKEEEERAGIFRRVSARARTTYHEVVNSAPTFPREIIIFPLVKSDSVTLMRTYIRREK